MIGIILNTPAFEQDIRELLMAYYPGETFVHEEGAEVSFYVRGSQNETQLFMEIVKKPFKEEENSEAEQVLFSGTANLVPENRTESKSAVKLLLYQFLKEMNGGRELPWGTLTGIRPTKIAMSRLDQGWSEQEIADFMKKQYQTSDEKINLSIEIAERERRLLSVLDYERGYSLYVGIPFCPTTCLYCSFTSYPIGKWRGKTHLYLDALFKELEYTAKRMQGRKLDTIYMGGGTPTSLSPEELDAIFTKMEELFDCKNALEFTVEAGRPDSITREKLEVMRKHGISRISINPQTMKQETLDLIGRHHTVDMVRDCFFMARELGFDNINMDLIVGLPDETLEDVRYTMEEVCKMHPDSITVHSLAIKRAARLNLFRELYEGKIHGSQEMIDLTATYARQEGFEPYYLYRQKNMAGNFENVGYAKPGKACLYNILIMEELQTIAACGAGTTTKVVFPAENRKERVENVKEVEQYIERIDEMIQRKEKLLANLC